MSVVYDARHYTPEDLLGLPNAVDYELVDGCLVERNMGAWSSYIGLTIGALLRAYCEPRQLAFVFPADCGYQCFANDPGKVRKPDASAVLCRRMSGERPPPGHLRLAPDIAVEVLSPNDLDYETDPKVEEYLAAGVRLVWIVNPETRTVLVYRADGTIGGLREHDEISGEDVLPGFTCKVAEFFKSAGAPAA